MIGTLNGIQAVSDENKETLDHYSFSDCSDEYSVVDAGKQLSSIEDAIGLVQIGHVLMYVCLILASVQLSSPILVVSVILCQRRC